MVLESQRGDSSESTDPTDDPTPKDRDVWMFERRSAVSALELPSIRPSSLCCFTKERVSRVSPRNTRIYRVAKVTLNIHTSSTTMKEGRCREILDFGNHAIIVQEYFTEFVSASSM